MEIVERSNKRRAGISDEKGPEYAGSDTNYRDDDADVLANFKRQGKRFNVSPLLAAGLYAGKHIDSFETTLRALEEKLAAGDTEGAAEIVARGEGFVSRLDDLRNYCDLIECILAELQIHPEQSLGVLEEKAKTQLVEEGLRPRLLLPYRPMCPEVRYNPYCKGSVDGRCCVRDPDE